MGKNQLDQKSQVAMTKYHEKNAPAKFDKQKHLEKLRADFLQKKQNHTDK